MLNWATFICGRGRSFQSALDCENYMQYNYEYTTLHVAIGLRHDATPSFMFDFGCACSTEKQFCVKIKFKIKASTYQLIDLLK